MLKVIVMVSEESDCFGGRCGITFAANVRERSTILQWDAVEALRAMMHSNITPPLRSRMQMARGRRDTGWFARDDKAKLSQILSFVK